MGGGIGGMFGKAAGGGGMLSGVNPTMGIADLAAGPNTMGAFGNMQAPKFTNPAWMQNYPR
jgi:hypothetical protein